MTTKSLTLAGTLAYPMPGGGTETETLSLLSSFTESAIGFIAVPDGTDSDTEFDLPMDLISEATFIYVRNLTGQEITFELNFGDDVSLQHGGAFIYAVPSGDGQDSPIFGVACYNLNTQVGDGTIEYRVFGNP